MQQRSSPAVCRWDVVPFDGFNGLSLNGPSARVIHLNQKIIKTFNCHFIICVPHFELSKQHGFRVSGSFPKVC